MQQEFVVYGWVRNNVDIIDDPYEDVIKVIISFFAQGYAKFFEEHEDTDYKTKMSFGDIVKTLDGLYKVLDINKQLQTVGGEDPEDPDWRDEYTPIFIPKDIICGYLFNAPLFYSKCNKLFNGELMLCLQSKTDDYWVLKHLGIINPDYILGLAIMFQDGGFHGLIIYYSYSIQKEINSLDNANDKDINRFYEIRQQKNKDNLVKIKVDYGDKWAMAPTDGTVLSFLWSANNSNRISYVGPKDQQQSAIAKLKAFHNIDDEDVDKRIEIVEVDNYDLLNK